MKRLLFLVLFLAGCHGHRVSRGTPVNRAGYAYVEVDDGDFVVLARSDETFKRALKEIGCGTCAMTFDGDLQAWLVRKYPK